eukprot:jgi/Botrbrau1/16858/Bobra.150_2s0078.1
MRRILDLGVSTQHRIFSHVIRHNDSITPAEDCCMTVARTRLLQHKFAFTYTPSEAIPHTPVWLFTMYNPRLIRSKQHELVYHT